MTKLAKHIGLCISPTRGQLVFNRILQIALCVIAGYGIYKIVDALLPAPMQAERVFNKSLSPSLIVIGAESALQKILDGALTTFGSSLAVYLLSKVKR